LACQEWNHQQWYRHLHDEVVATQKLAQDTVVAIQDWRLDDASALLEKTREAHRVNLLLEPAVSYSLEHVSRDQMSDQERAFWQAAILRLIEISSEALAGAEGSYMLLESR
jgi:hypothetical protein